MDKGKEVTLYILEQYRDHCQTTVNMGEDADKENLKEVKEAIKWVKALFGVSKKEFEEAKEIAYNKGRTKGYWEGHSA